MSLNTAVSFFTVFHTIARVLVGEPQVTEVPPELLPATPESTRSQIVPARSLTEFWFATPDSPGAIALGMAEGTRTIDGVRTSAWYQHVDPGNARVNVGTFSSQNTNLSPDLADAAELERIRKQLEAFARDYPYLSPLEYLSAADLSIQARGAFPAFGDHLEAVKQSDVRQPPADVVIEARVRSFYNPESGELEAGGFGNDEAALRRDQMRRTLELQRKIHRVEKYSPDSLEIANSTR